MVIGIALTEIIVNHGHDFFTFSIPPWETSRIEGTSISSIQAIHNIRNGTISLGKTEGVIFQATKDNNNDPLIASKTYELRGSLPENAFFTLYPAHKNSLQPLYPKGEMPFALNSFNIVRTSDTGGFIIHLSPSPQPGNWLKTLTNDQQYKLVLTLYDSTILTSNAIKNYVMPTIYPIKEGDVLK